MARPPKGGIDYFPFDVGFFDNKEKIKPLIARYGADAVALLLYLYCDIYKNGFFITVDEDYLHICSMELRMNHNKIRQMLNYFLERSLFDHTLFKAVKVLTARAIQERYQLAVRERVRKNKAPILVDRKLWLIPENEVTEVSVKNENGTTFIKVISFLDIPGNNPVFPRKNEDNPWENDTKESKGKKSNNIYMSVPVQNPYFANDELNQAFALYVNYRISNGDKLQPEQIVLLKEQLEGLADKDTERIAIVKQATMKGWKGFYPLKGSREAQSGNQRVKPKNRFKNFEENSHDYSALERQLFEKLRNGRETGKL